MKRLQLLFLFLLSLAFVNGAYAQKHPKKYNKHAFAHESEASNHKNNRMHFRPENDKHPVIDLHPHSVTKFKTAKAGKNFKFSK